MSDEAAHAYAGVPLGARGIEAGRAGCASGGPALELGGESGGRR